MEDAILELVEYVDEDKAAKYFDNIKKGHISFDFTSWRVICLGRWLMLNK
jgi:hypothetical protein